MGCAGDGVVFIQGGHERPHKVTSEQRLKEKSETVWDIFREKVLGKRNKRKGTELGARVVYVKKSMKAVWLQ